MATFVTRTRKDKSTYTLAQITRRAVNFTENRSFPGPANAKAWATKREREVDAAIAAGRDPSNKVQRVTLGDAIDKYVAETMKEIGKTKVQVLKTIRAEYDIAAALLHKSAEGQSFPFRRRTYPLASVIGVPSAVKPFGTATRTWNSAT
jgi:hypothetical protein